MAKRVERGRQASAQRSPSDHQPQFSQPFRPGTPFSVPQRDDVTSTSDHRPQFSQPSRPGTPFSVPLRDDVTSSQWGKHVTITKYPRAFACPGVLRLTRHKFRCQEPYKDKTFKVPDAHTADRLRTLRALTKMSSSKKALDPIKELKVILEGNVPLPPKVPEFKSGNSRSRELKPSALQPATRKRMASVLVTTHGKVPRSLNIPTVLEQHTDLDQLGTGVPATSSGNGAGDANEKLKEGDKVPGTSAEFLTDQRGLVISPHSQGFLQPSPPTHGALGCSTSSQDPQGLSLSTQEVLGGIQCNQGAMEHSTSAQASQKPPSCSERKIKHVSSSRRGFISPSSTQGVTNLSSFSPKSFRQCPSDQGGLQQAPSDQESSKLSSPKGELSDLSLSQIEFSATTTSEGCLTPLTAVQGGSSDTSSHEDIQGNCSPFAKGPNQSTSPKESLTLVPSEEGNFITSPLNQKNLNGPLTLKNGLRFKVQRVLSPTTISQVSLTPLISAQAETKMSTSTSGAQESLPSSEGALESSTYTQEEVGTPEYAQGSLGPSQHTQKVLAPSPSSSRDVSPLVSFKGTPKLFTSRAEGQRSLLSHKSQLKCSLSRKREPEYSPPGKIICSKQGNFTVSQSQEGFIYPLPAKKALLSRYRVQNSHKYAKKHQVSHARSTSAKGAETKQPSLLPQGSLGLSTTVREALGISTYAPGVLEHSLYVQDSLGSTLSDKGTVGQDTTKGVSAKSSSLEATHGCDTSTKDVPGHSPPAHRVLTPTLCDRGSLERDTCTHESIPNSICREGGSLDSTCTQETTGPSHTLEEAMGICLSSLEHLQFATNAQETKDPFPSAQTTVSPSTCPQVSSEHPTNTPKPLRSILSDQEALGPICSVQLPLKPDTSIENSLSSHTPEESFPGTFTYTEGNIETVLPSQEAHRPLTYARDALEETTSTQEVLVPSPHSKAIVKKGTCTQGSSHSSSPEREALGSTIAEQGALQFSLSTQEGFMYIPSHKGTIKHSSSTQADLEYPIYTKERLRDDPEDQWDFRPSSSEEDSFIHLPSAKRVCGASTVPEETPVATDNPQVSPSPSVSVQKTVGPCKSAQGPLEHSISSEDTQRPSLAVPKSLQCSALDPGFQKHSPYLSRALENCPQAQGAWSLSESDLKAVKHSLFAKESEAKSTSVQKSLGLVPLVQEVPVSSSASKDLSTSCLFAAEHLSSLPGSPKPSTSNQGNLAMSPSVQGSLGRSSSAPGALCCFQSALGTIELFPSVQGGIQQCLHSSLNYTGHMPHLPGDLGLSSLEHGRLESSQGALETSSCSHGDKGLLRSLQRPLYLSVPAHEAAGTSPSIQGAPGPSLPSRVETSQSVQGLIRVLPSAQAALKISPSAFVALKPLPVAPEPLGPLAVSQETLLHSPHFHGVGELSQYGSGATNLMPYAQGQQGSSSPSKGSIAPMPPDKAMEFSKSTHRTQEQSLSCLGDKAPSLPSEGTLVPLSSMDVETYSHAPGSPAHLTNVSGIPEYVMSDHDSVGISFPAKRTLRHLPSDQRDVGLSLSTQRAQELYKLGQDTILPLDPTQLALINPVSSQGKTEHFPCSQSASEHFPPSVGALKHFPSHKGNRQFLTSAQKSFQILPSNSESVKNSHSAIGGLKSSPSAPRALGHMLSVKDPEKLSLSAQPFLGNSLSAQEIQKHLAHSAKTLKPCQSTKESPSQILEKCVPSTPRTLGAFSSAPGHTEPFSLANETPPEHSKYNKAVIKSSSATRALGHMAFTQKSLRKSFSGQEVIETLSSSQGSLELSTCTKGRAKNVLPPVKPPTSLQEASRTLLSEDPHHHSLSAPGPLGPCRPVIGMQRPLSTSKSAGNSIILPDSCQSYQSIEQTLDNLQSTEGPIDRSLSEQGFLDPLPSNQRVLGLLGSSPRIMESTESEHRKLVHLSYVGNNGEMSSSDIIAKGGSPFAPQSHFPAEVLESSSAPQASQWSSSSATEGVKDSSSVLGEQKPSPYTSQALEHLETTQGPHQIYTPAKQTLCPLPSTLGDVEHDSSSRAVLRGSQAVKSVHSYLSNKVKGVESSLSALGMTDNSPFAPGPSELSSLPNTTQLPSPCSQEVLGSFLSVESLLPSPSVQGFLGPSEPMIGGGGLFSSEEDNVELSASAPGTKAHLQSFPRFSASKHYEQRKVEHLSSVHGDLGLPLSRQRSLGVSKSTERARENLPHAKGTTKLPTCSQEVDKSSLSDQGHLPHLPCVTEALGPSLSDQKTEEFLLPPSEGIEHSPSAPGSQVKEPSSSNPRTQDSLLSIGESPELSLYSFETLYPIPTTIEAVELSTSTPECPGPSQPAHGELGYLSSVRQAIEYSPTVSLTTRTLSSPQSYERHSSSTPNAQEHSQCDQGDIAPLLSYQGPQKPSTLLTQGMLNPTASTQESPETSESFQGDGETHQYQSSQRIHGYFLPVVEPVEALASMSETTVASPSAPPPLEQSSLLQMTSTISLTDQGIVVPNIPSHKKIVPLPLAQGTLEHLASVQGGRKNSQFETNNVGQSISEQEIIGSLPCTTGAIGLTPYVDRNPEMMPSTQEAAKKSLCYRGDLGLPISANVAPENLTSDQGLTKHSNSLYDTPRHSLVFQDPEKDSQSTEQCLKPYSSQGIKKTLLSFPGAVKPSSSAKDSQKPLQTSLESLPTLLFNQGIQNHCGSVKHISGSLPSSSESQENSSSSPSIPQSSASFQKSKLGHLSCMEESEGPLLSVQGTTGLLPFSSGTTGHLNNQESFLSVSRDLTNLLSTQLSSQGNLCLSPYTQQPLQQSTCPQEILVPSQSPESTSKHLSSVPNALKMSPFVPVTTDTLLSAPLVPSHSSLTQASLAPSSSLINDEGSCLHTQETLKMSTSTKGTLETSPSTHVPGKVSTDEKATLGQLSSTQVTEGYSDFTSEALRSSQRSQNELEVFHPSQGPLIISLCTQGSLGSGSSSQGSLKLSMPKKVTVGTRSSVQSVLKHQTSSQEVPRSSPSVQCTLQGPESSPRATRAFLSSQETQEYFHSSPEDIEHSPSALGTQGCSLSVAGNLESFLTSKGPKEVSVATEGTLSSQSSLPYIQQLLEPSVYCSKGLGQYKCSHSTLENWHHMEEDVESSKSVPGVKGALPSSLVSEEHSTYTQVASESFPYGQGYLAPLKPSQGPLKLSISAKAMPHTLKSTEGALQPSAHSSAIPQTNTNSPSTRGTVGTPSYAPGLLSFSASPQATPSSSCSDKEAGGPYLSGQGTLKMSKSEKGSLVSPSTSQGTQGHSISAQCSVEQCQSTHQTVEPTPPTMGPPRSTQNTQVLLESVPLYRRPMKTSLSVRGTIQSFPSVQGALRPSLSSLGSIKLSTISQGAVGIMSSSHSALKHPTVSQEAPRSFASVQCTVQGPASSSKVTGPFLPSWESQGSVFSSPEDVEHSPSAPGPQKHHHSVAGTLGPLLSSKGPKEVSPDSDVTLSVQCSLSSLQRYLDPSVHSSSSGLGSREPFPFNQVSIEHSTHMPGEPAPLSAHSPLEISVSAQCSLSPSVSSKGTLEPLSSSTDILERFKYTQNCHGKLSHVGESLESSPSHVGPSIYVPFTPESLEHSPLEEGIKANCHSAQRTVDSSLYTHRTMGLSTSTQRTLGHTSSSQGLSSTSSHTQGTCSQSTFAQSTVSHSLLNPVSQEYTHHAQNIRNLKSSRWSPRISIIAKGSLEPLPSPRKPIRTSPSIQGARETPSLAQGSVETAPATQSLLGIKSPLVGPLGSSKITLDISEPFPLFQEIHAPLKSISRSLETLTSIPEAVRLSTSAQGVLGSSISDQVILGSLTFPQETTEISPSDKEFVKPAPSQAGPIRPSLTDQVLQEVSSGKKVTLQDLSPQKTYLENSLSTQGALGLSTSVIETLGHSPSAQETPHIFFLSQGTPGPCLDQVSLGQSSSDPRDIRCSESFQKKIEKSPSTQSTLETLSCTHGNIEALPPANDSQGHLPSSQQAFQPSLLMTEVSKTLPWTNEACNRSDSSLGTLGNSPSSPGSMRLSVSTQDPMGPSVSEKEILQPKISSEETLEPSPSDQESLRPTLSASGPESCFPLDQGCQETFSSAQGHLLSQQGCTGNLLHSQDSLRLSTSERESLGHVPSPQGHQCTSLSSQESPDPCLDQGNLGQSSSNPGEHGLSESSLETSPSTQINPDILSSTHRITETSTSAQDSLGHLPSSVQALQPSLLMPEKVEPLLTTKKGFKISESMPGNLEIQTLRLLNSNQDALSPLVSDQENLGPSASLHDTKEHPKPAQGSLEPMSSTKEALGPSLITEFSGLSICVPDDLTPIPSHENCPKHSPCHKINSRLSNSTKNMSKRILFPEEYSRYSLSQVDGLMSSPYAKSGLTSSTYAKKDSHLTCTTQRRILHSTSQELSLRSNSPPKEDLMCSLSPRGGSRHSKSKKKSRYTSEAAGLKSVPSEEEGLKLCHSSKIRITALISDKGGVRPQTEHKENLSTSSAKRDCRSPCSQEKSQRSSLFPQGHSKSTKGSSKSTKMKLEKTSSGKEEGYYSHSQHEGCKQPSLSKSGPRLYSCTKMHEKPKATPQESIEPFISKGGHRSSQFHEDGRRGSPSSQDIPRHSKYTKTELRKVHSDKADAHAYHSEQKDCKQSSSSTKGPRYSLSTNRDQKPKAAMQEIIESSISTEDYVGTNPFQEENLRHSTFPHGSSSHTTLTSTLTRPRHAPYTQEAIKTSHEAQESFNSFTDKDIPNGSVSLSSPPQSGDVRHPVSTVEGFRKALFVQEEQKTSTSARERPLAFSPVKRGLIYSPAPKESYTTFPVVQGKFRHTLSLLADLRSSLSYQWKGTAFQYEHGAPICDPSVLGGHRYIHSLSCNLRRIPLQKGSWSSKLSPKGGISPSQCDQKDLRISNGHPVQASLRIFQAESKILKYIASNKTSLRCGLCDQREFRNVPSNQEYVRTSTSVLGTSQYTPSQHGGYRPYKPVKLKF